MQETKRKQRCYGSETRLRLTCWALSPYPPLNEARAENVKQHADGAERCLVTAPVVPAGGVRGGRGRTKTAVGILAPPHYNNLRGRQAPLKPCGLHRLGGDVVSVKVSGRRAAPGRFTDFRASPIMRDASQCPISQYDMFCSSVCVCVCVCVCLEYVRL